MSEITFYSKPFKIEGIQIPEIVLTKGKLVRLYVPNLIKKDVPIDLKLKIINHFQNKDHLPWAKNFSPDSFIEKFYPLTVERYLLKVMKLNKYKAIQAIEEIEVNFEDRFNYLDHIKKRALIIKANFLKHDVILFDYYAIGLLGAKLIENIVNTEIEKGKSAIAFDSLEYMEAYEPFANIQRLIVD
ncbi:hypothetical protein [uncultured Kordia sp.]|uniref:hypothetical protein n=1 Tax=uncultured Kordia sp. TaxID=507699 RepID=UPI0026289D34|nr:hypothetical protein [uncultured Kordia sp.]